MIIVCIFIVAGIVALVAFNAHNQPIRDARNAEAAERVRASNERRAAAIAARDAFKEGFRQDWVFNECLFRNSSALFGLKQDFSSVCIAPYELDEEFRQAEFIEVPIEQVVTAALQRDDVRETFYRTEIVPVAMKNKKSPVGRAVVGGLLLGPAGVVMGAASGLGGKTKIITEERKVADERIVKGRPKLALGTAGQHGLLKISFHADSTAEHWLHQIRVARLSRRLPPLQ